MFQAQVLRIIPQWLQADILHRSHGTAEAVPLQKKNPSFRRRVRVFFVAATVLPLLLGGCRRKHFPKYPTDFREYAWVTNGGGNSVTVLDLVHMTTAATIPVGDDPVDVAVNPTRDEVYVVNRGSGTVSVIDAAAHRVVATIGVHREPESITVDATGERARRERWAWAKRRAWCAFHRMARPWW
jgi:YVTN family beta-propeller protein